jgi:hypothetical protein
VRHLVQGQIVEVEIADPRGQNKKRRPVVLITSSDELASADKYVAVAISSRLADPLPSDWILLPWSADGRARSGLTKPCAAKCHWMITVRETNIVSVVGALPETVMRDIMLIVAKEK